jgi:hypothetical protein
MVTVYVWPVVLLSFLSKESNQRKVAAWFRTVKGRAATMPVPAVRYAMPHLPLIVGFFGFRNSSPATQIATSPLTRVNAKNEAIFDKQVGYRHVEACHASARNDASIKSSVIARYEAILDRQVHKHFKDCRANARNDAVKQKSSLWLLFCLCYICLKILIFQHYTHIAKLLNSLGYKFVNVAFA